MLRDQVMNRDHPRWNEFIEELSRAVICRQTTENAQRVLASIDAVDVDRSLAALHLLGGSCDCEIVYQLAGRAERVPA
jgi:hypothetical protein